MPFPFPVVCDLLQDLDNDRKRKQTRGSKEITKIWFSENRGLIHEQNDVDPVALLSTLLPERRTDRVYSIKEKSLERIVSTALGLGSRKELLRRWEKTPRAGLDLAECVEDVMAQAPNDVRQVVTVEEIDTILHQLASTVSFSSRAVKSSRPTSTPSLGKGDHLLASLYRRLSPRDAKWFCRLVLKNFQPVVVPEYTVYSCYHHLLPTTLKIHDNFAVAVGLLQQHVRVATSRGTSLNKAELPKIIKPKVGVKVGRQTWLKARGIKQCLDMGWGWMSCEAKMDGEYCQVHVDLSKGEKDRIQIFSKSGKDSTMDRKKLHSAIKTSLGIGTDACKFKERCILEGELVVYSDLDKKILGFEKIRKHINRSGRMIGTSKDSQAHDWEHLMIVWFDVLLVDDQSMLSQTHMVRRKRLASMVRCKEGQAALVESCNINFSSRTAAEELREAFAKCIRNREEGLVLKADEPYFSFDAARRYESCCLKLKKGYIKGLGDVGDFAVIGARHDPIAAEVLGLPNIKFTHFYLGCITNKDMALRFQAKPMFKVVNEVKLNTTTMAEYFSRHVFVMDVLPEDNDKLLIDATPGIMDGKKMTAVFLEPAVFDMTCFDYHKECDTDFWSLRFPYVSKIHTDRQWQDCMSFDELQRLAKEGDSRTDDTESQELLEWIEKLENAESKRRRKAEGRVTTNSPSAIASTSMDSRTSDIRRFLHTPAAEPVPPPGVVPAPSLAAPHPQASSPKGQSPRKRRRGASPDSGRRARPRTDVVDLTASPTVQNSQQSARQPLSDITDSPSSQTNGLPSSTPRLSRSVTVPEEPKNAQSSPGPARLPTASSFQTATAFSSPPKKAAPTSSGAAPTRTPALPVCPHAGTLCALADYSVLLSPCIAHLPWLYDDLLPSHGVRAIYRDIASWQASFHLPTAGSSYAQHRMVLVEARRVEETKAFMEAVYGGGKGARVLAYDWRLVEAITEVEQKLRKSDGSGTRQRAGTGANARELWRRYHVGVC